MAATRMDELVVGTLTMQGGSLPASVVGNSNVTAGAGIDASKLERQVVRGFSQSGTATTVTQPVHVVSGATGTVLRAYAGSIVAAVGNATVTVRFRKNGTTILSSDITLDNANTAYIVEQGTLSVTSAVAGDMFDVVITATVGTGTLPTGLVVGMVLDEDPIT
jgi:hypothetical protein